MASKSQEFEQFSKKDNETTHLNLKYFLKDPLFSESYNYEWSGT